MENILFDQFPVADQVVKVDKAVQAENVLQTKSIGTNTEPSETNEAVELD